jgi:hypothetical protein
MDDIDGAFRLDELVEDEIEEASNSKLWSEIVVVTDDTSDAKSLTARHEGDVTIRAIFRYEYGEGWQYESEDFDDDGFDDPTTTTYQLRYREKSGQFYFREKNGGPPEVYLWNITANTWFRVVTEPESEPESERIFCQIRRASVRP